MGEIAKFYASSRRPIPEDRIFDAEVALAMDEWAAIPTQRLPEVCKEARARAGAFLPTNAQVLQVWNDLNSPDRGEEAYRRRVHRETMEKAGKYIAAPGSEPPHPEEIPKLMEEVWKAAGLKRGGKDE